MDYRKIALGALAYTLVTFPLAVIWHVIAFEQQYQAFRYIEGEPSFVIGFVTILLQGIIMSALYPRVSLAGSALVRGLKYGLILGAFFWTSHVLAFVAKREMADTGLFIAMESVYLLLQFGIYGALIGLTYRNIGG